ncbi:MAG: hypothetical protein R6V49_00575, partial [Bacteroidales bacterium]
LYISGIHYPGATKLASARLLLALLVFIATFLIPSVMVWMMKSTGFVSSFQMPQRRERTLPFLLTAILYYVAYQYFGRYNLPAEYSLLLLGATAMILVAMFINLKWKISIHMMGIGGAIGVLHGMAVYFPHSFLVPVAVGFALAGLLGTARLTSGSHRPAEVYVGFLVGYFLFLVLFSSVLSR